MQTQPQGNLEGGNERPVGMGNWCNGLLEPVTSDPPIMFTQQTYSHLPPPPVSHVISALMSRQAPACPALPSHMFTLLHPHL